tara:strand:+ start:4739 stop:5650 length:912 start_codon:yes stop_codon:yes gene_type:complete
MGWSADNIPSLEGRLALVTGANVGLGLETTRQLARNGAKVVMACRDQGKAEAARQRLLDEGCTNLETLELDLGDLNSVRDGVERLQQRHQRLDLLMNNAGVMAPPRRLSPQGHEWQLAVNHFGHMALTLGVLPLLTAGADPRVVTVTSGAQYFGQIRWDDLTWSQRYDRYGAYAQSKLANVMFALELDARLREQNSPVQSLAAHPGLAKTNLQPTALASAGQPLEALSYQLMGPLFQSPEMGALPQLHAATAPSARGGEHYGPNQFGGLRGYPCQCRIAPAALDSAQRQRLWSISQELIDRGR